MPLTGEIYTAEEFITGRVDVYDPLNDGDVVPGLREPGPEDLVASANTLVLSASDAIGNVSDSLNELTMNLNTVLTGLAREITGEGEGTIKAELVEAIEELQMDLGKIRELADNLNSILLDARPRIEGILTDIEGATTSIDNATSTVDEFITDPEITESIRTAIANIEEASERVLATVEEIETLVSDEQLRADILGLVSDARDTMAKASDSIDKANAAMGTVSDTDVGGEFRVRYLTEPERVASDLEFSIAPSGSNAFYQFGVEDIGDADDFTFQLGYGGRTGMRGLFGIKRGHIGAGFDYRTDMFSLRGDVYDPNDVHFDIYGGVAISDDFRFIIGFEDLYDEDFFHIGIATEF
jgi:ABC-type transporter Mla subunit MlaD